MSGTTTTRYELEYATRPSMQHSLTMYMFGCEVLVLRDKALRGPYASESNGRTFRGRLLGIDGESYMVEKENGQIVYPHHVTPLNEVEMVRSGLLLARDVSDAGTHTQYAQGCCGARRTLRQRRRPARCRRVNQRIHWCRSLRLRRWQCTMATRSTCYFYIVATRMRLIASRHV